MRGHAGKLSLHRQGSTAGARPASRSHNDATPSERQARSSRHYLPNTFDRQLAPLKWVLLFVLLFSQYGTTWALVGKPRLSWSVWSSAATPVLGEESIARAVEQDMMLASNGLDLKKRQSQEPTLASDPSAGSPSSFPQPFDGGVGNNFTAPSCPLFFQNFLQDPTFQACHAVSLLLTTSQGFFHASRSAQSVNDLLQASCSADLQVCKGVMDKYARGIKAKGACKADFEAQNPNVLQALEGFLAYESVYNATCQRSSESDGYCFTESVTNASSPTSSYVYFLPLGLDLPATTQPTCNKCLETTMNNYAAYAGNGSLPLSSVYGSAVQAVDQTCGPRFVGAAIPPVVGAASRAHLPSFVLVIFSVLTTICLW